uniref:Uncharacterized protein n=1 Tax=Aegilops tauschii TaxID=37682 RepID=M8C299_AEGTA
MEHNGMDRDMVEYGYNLMLYCVYAYIPDPPVSPAATLSLSGVPDGVDRISRLPDAVLRDIVSRLPAKDAARTAALASRWRSIWRSAPLSLVDSHLLPDGGASGPFIIGAPSPRAITAAVSSALAAHPGPFRCVHLTRGTMDEHRGEMARWIDILVAKGVQELSRRISEESTGKVNLRFWQEGGPIKCVMESTKKVFFYEFRGTRSEVTFLKFVAERARVLEQMVVVVTRECFSSGDDNVSAKLKPLTTCN